MARLAIVRTGQLFLLLAILVGMLGCGGNKTLRFYPGEPRTAEDVAIIDIGFKSAMVTGIDDYQKGDGRIEISERYIEVLPGEHVLTVHYTSWKGRSREPIYLAFDARPGHSYRVVTEGGFRRWNAWIVEVGSEVTVSRSVDSWR